MNGLTLLVCCLMAYQQAVQVGPANGSLLLVGGGAQIWGNNLSLWLEGSSLHFGCYAPNWREQFLPIPHRFTLKLQS